MFIISFLLIGEFNQTPYIGQNVGAIECIIQDIITRESLPDAIIEIQETNEKYTAIGETFTITLPPGDYTITTTKPDYVDCIAKVTVKPGVKSKLIFNMEKTEETLKKETELLEKEININKYFEQAVAYYTENKLDDAKITFKMVLSLNPDHEETKEYLTKVEIRRVELIALYSNKAKLKTQTDYLEMAIEYWQKVLDIDPENSEAQNAIDSLQICITAAKKPTKPKQPAKPFTTNAEIDTLFNKGVSYFTEEKYDDALKMFRHVLALNPNHASAQDYKNRTEARIKALE